MAYNKAREFYKGKLEGYHEAWEMIQVLLPEGHTLKPVKFRHAIGVLVYKISRIVEDAGASSDRYKYPEKIQLSRMDE